MLGLVPGARAGKYLFQPFPLSKMQYEMFCILSSNSAKKEFQL